MSSIGHEPAQLTVDERALLALEDAMLLAIRHRDAAGVAALLTDDFVLLVGNGTQAARGQFIEAASSIPGEILELAAEHLRARAEWASSLASSGPGSGSTTGPRSPRCRPSPTSVSGRRRAGESHWPTPRW